MPAKKPHEGVENVYAAAQKWVDAALRSDDSLFTPGTQIWTLELLGELRRRFLDQPDVTGSDFYDKLGQQLRDSPPEVYQLMGEVLYAQFLIVWKGGMGQEVKKIGVERVLSWGAPASTLPNDLIDGLTPGVAHSEALLTFRPYQVGFMIEFVEQWKQREPAERERLLREPWAFKKFAMEMRFRSRLLRNNQETPRSQKHALLHLVFPNSFEGIVSVEHKEQIASANAFAHLVIEGTSDVDRKLEQIRESLEKSLGRDFDFYDQHFRPLWQSTSPNPWDTYIGLAYEVLDTRTICTELEYKLEIGQKIATAREATLNGGDNWPELVKNGLSGDIVPWQENVNFHNWIDSSPDEVRRALEAIWTQDDASVDARVLAFSAVFPKSVTSGPGTRMNVVSQLLMGVDVENYPPLRVRRFNRAYERTDYPPTAQDADEAALYTHALGFLDRFISEARTRGLPIRHRLDAQSIVWIIQGMESEAGEQEPHLPAGESAEESSVELDELASRLFLTEPADFLHEIETLLADKKQVIFQGPPGTGKTYVAQQLANHLAGSPDRVTLVQFHPSYAYEDFVRGFRPKLTNGQASFELRDGPLIQAAKRAKAEDDPDGKHFLIIDEINRGSIAKVFGELYFLLEYRNQAITLQYQRDDEDDFSLPDNLYIIGTMNTADRSIALIDLALRRRFYFMDFHPDEEPIRGVLRRWLRAKQPNMEWVADVVKEANRLLKDDRHAAIGPSYFMRDDLNEDGVKRIWKHSVLPYIEERLFGQSDRLGDFALDKLRSVAQTDGGSPEDDDGAGDEDGGAVDASD